MYSRGLFFAVILVTGGILARPVASAPAVKTFGTTTGTSAYGNVRGRGMQTTSSTTATKNGTSSARALALAAKPTTKATGGTYVGTTTKTTGNVGTVRTPGMHGNIIKGISSKLSSNNSSSQGGGNTSDLEQRVAALEAEMPTKQDILEPGDGIDITGTTISLSEDVATLSDKVDEMAQDIEDLNDRVDPEKYYTIEKTQEYLQENYYTRDDVDQITGQISQPDIVDDFDPTFLTKGN